MWLLLVQPGHCNSDREEVGFSLLNTHTHTHIHCTDRAHRASGEQRVRVCVCVRARERGENGPKKKTLTPAARLLPPNAAGAVRTVEKSCVWRLGNSENFAVKVLPLLPKPSAKCGPEYGRTVSDGVDTVSGRPSAVKLE